MLNRIKVNALISLVDFDSQILQLTFKYSELLVLAT